MVNVPTDAEPPERSTDVAPLITALSKVPGAAPPIQLLPRSQPPLLPDHVTSAANAAVVRAVVEISSSGSSAARLPNGLAFKVLERDRRIFASPPNSSARHVIRADRYKAGRCLVLCRSAGKETARSQPIPGQHRN